MKKTGLLLLVILVVGLLFAGCSKTSNNTAANTQNNAAYAQPNSTGGEQQPAQESTTDQQSVVPSDFVIEGKWKNVGENTFGQASKGAIIVFNGANCNYYSPKDTYAFYRQGDSYVLDCTSLLGETLSFKVNIIDENNIEITYSSKAVSLTRVG